MKILVAPLNWGLGHATRCIPIINELLDQNIDVHIASDGPALDLLKAEYPQLPTHILPGYNVHYKGQNMALSMFLQSFKILKAIKREHQWLQHIVKDNGIDAVISDSRFGCYSKKTPSVIISHQLNIIAPSWSTTIINRYNKRLLQCFNKIWVPDLPPPHSIASSLTKMSKRYETQANYIGTLSRMTKMNLKRVNDIAIILSGPEPQRTELEKEIIKQAIQLLDKRIVIVRGLMDNEPYEDRLPPHIQIIPYLTTSKLNELMSSSALIIARSGYSTIMDLHKLEKQAVLIPTPGQTEQEYLALKLKETEICDIQYQGELDILKGYEDKAKFKGFKNPNLEGMQLKETIRDWLMTV